MKATEAQDIVIKSAKPKSYEDVLNDIFLNILATASLGGEGMEMDLSFGDNLNINDTSPLHSFLMKHLRALGYEVYQEYGIYQISWQKKTEIKIQVDKTGEWK